MRSTLSDNRQMFNVKKIADAGLTPTQIPNGEFGIVDMETDLTVKPESFEDLPNKFRFISKMGSKVYYSFDTIDKTCCKINKAVAVEPSDYQINIHEAMIQHCKCIDGFKLNVGIEDAELIQTDGLTWTHRDTIVDVTPEELLCYCSCTGEFPVYENNVYTQVIAEKVNNMGSTYYEAEVRNADTNEVITDPKAFVEENKEINTKEELEEGEERGPMLKLVLKTKAPIQEGLNNFNINYTYPRGSRIEPVLTLNNSSKVIPFKEIQEVQFEQGAGYDLKAEEFEYMNLYTDLNYNILVSENLPNPALKYQFKDDESYYVVNFEFESEKSGLQGDNLGRFTACGVLLGTTDKDVYDTLKALFVK